MSGPTRLPGRRAQRTGGARRHQHPEWGGRPLAHDRLVGRSLRGPFTRALPQAAPGLVLTLRVGEHAMGGMRVLGRIRCSYQRMHRDIPPGARRDVAKGLRGRCPQRLVRVAQAQGVAGAWGTAQGGRSSLRVRGRKGLDRSASRSSGPRRSRALRPACQLLAAEALDRFRRIVPVDRAGRRPDQDNPLRTATAPRNPGRPSCARSGPGGAFRQA